MLTYIQTLSQRRFDLKKSLFHFCFTISNAVHGEFTLGSFSLNLLFSSCAMTKSSHRSAVKGKRDVRFVCFVLIFSSSSCSRTSSFQGGDGKHRRGVKRSWGGAEGTESCFVFFLLGAVCVEVEATWLCVGALWCGYLSVVAHEWLFSVPSVYREVSWWCIF